MKFLTILLFLVLSSNAKVLENVSERVAGGRPAILGEIPYFALIQMRLNQGDFSQCGGSLIRYNWILTLARCISQNYNDWFIQLGIVNRYAIPMFQTRITNRVNLFQHPSHVESIYFYDIGLIRLEDATPNLLNNPFIGVVNLPLSSDVNLNGIECQVSGFGLTDSSGSMSSFMHVGEMEVIDNAFCEREFPLFVNDENLCTNTTDAGTPCRGDEGGPLTANFDQNRHTLIGIVGRTTELCTSRLPGVFTRVSYHLDWIYSIIDDGTKTTEIPTTTQTLPTNFPTTTETLPTNFPTTTETLPTNFPTTTETLPTNFPTTTETLPTNFPTTTETLPTNFPTTTETTTTQLTTEPSTEPAPLSAPKSVQLSFILSLLICLINALK